MVLHLILTRFQPGDWWPIHFPNRFNGLPSAPTMKPLKRLREILTDKFTRLKPGENEMKKVTVNHVKGGVPLQLMLTLGVREWHNRTKPSLILRRSDKRADHAAVVPRRAVI